MSDFETVPTGTLAKLHIAELELAVAWDGLASARREAIIRQEKIERLKNLREATEKWRIQTAEACERARDERDHYRDKYHECNAEIERLRAALERIAEGCDLSNEAQALAREALRMAGRDA